MDKDKLFREFLESFNRIINKYNTINKIVFDYGSGDLLYPAEIHTLNAIDKYKDENITELGRRLGISKSAVSQVVNKLYKKKLINKYKERDNEKNILLKITDKGESALKGFNEFKSDIFHDLILELERLNTDQIDFLKYIFNKIEENLDYKIKKYF